MRRLFNFGKPKYQAPQISPIPEGQTTDQNGTYINEAGRQIIVKIFDDGSPKALKEALGDLEIAKDVVKNTLSQWHFKDQRRSGILVPNGKTKESLHVQ